MSDVCVSYLEPPGQRCRILVAEDDDMVRQVLERYLARQSMDVQAASDEQEALRLFQDNSFDLVISDLRMPGLDGLQLLQAIKVLNPRLPFVFISGYGDIPTVVDALKAGAGKFLAKPVEMRELARVVQQALNLVATQALPLVQLASMRQITFLEVPSRPEYIHDIVSQVAHSAVCVGYTDCDLNNNLKLALVEALANAMEHGNRWDERLSVRLEADITSDCLEISIQDHGLDFTMSGPCPTPSPATTCSANAAAECS